MTEKKIKNLELEMNQVSWYHKNIACSAETCCSLEFGYSWTNICGEKFKFGAILESFSDEYLFQPSLCSFMSRLYTDCGGEMVLYKIISVFLPSTNTLGEILAISVTFSIQL